MKKKKHANNCSNCNNTMFEDVYNEAIDACIKELMEAKDMEEGIRLVKELKK